MARSFSAGSSQAIEVASAASINAGSGDFTVLAWVRFPTPPANDSMIVGKRAGGFDGDEGWELKFNNGGDGSIRWDVETDAAGRQRAEATASGIVNGNWHLIGGDHTDGTPAQLQLWYDGTIINTKLAATPGSVDTATPLTIAAAYNAPNTNHLTGYVGPVLFAKRLLTLAEHQMLALGLSARLLRPLPAFLMELISRGSPEPDIVGGLTGTLVNAPDVVANPRIILPRSADLGQDLWYEFANATIDGQSNLNVTQTRGRTAALTIAGQSALTATILPKVAVTATIAAQSSVTADISPEAPLRATVAAQSALSAAVNINAGVGTVPIEGQSTLSATLSASVPVLTAIAANSAVTATMTPAVPVAATIPAQSSLSVTGDRIRTIATSAAGQSTASASATVTAGVGALVAAQSALSGSLSATVPASIAIASQSDIVADPSVFVPVTTTVAGSSAAAATATRGQGAEATVTAQSTLTADLAPRVPADVVIVGQSALSASASVTASIVSTIDGQSDMIVRPTFPGVKRTTTVGGVIRWLATVGGRISR